MCLSYMLYFFIHSAVPFYCFPPEGWWPMVTKDTGGPSAVATRWQNALCAWERGVEPSGEPGWPFPAAALSRLHQYYFFISYFGVFGYRAWSSFPSKVCECCCSYLRVGHSRLAAGFAIVSQSLKRINVLTKLVRLLKSSACTGSPVHHKPGVISLP